MDPEMIFAQKLAGNDQRLRDRALKKLRRWLLSRANHGNGFTETDLLRVWKGLFYCMWMSDKPLIQEELAETISGLVHSFKGHDSQGLCFIKCFFLTMGREWTGIDRFRLEKFMMLVRRFVRQSFMYASNESWRPELCSELSSLFSTTIINPTWETRQGTSLLGLQFHFADVFMEELAKVGGGDLTHQQIWVFVEPFATQIALGQDPRLTDHVEERIFKHLMRQSDSGIDYEGQFEDGHKGKVTDMEKVTEEDEDELIVGNEPLDPRAGNVDVTLDQLEVDYADLASRLLDRVDNVAPRNRKQLFRLIQQYRDLSGGIYPLAVRVPAVPSKGSTRQMYDKAIERGVNFEVEWKKTLAQEKEGIMPSEEEILERERQEKEAFKAGKKLGKKQRRKRRMKARKKSSFQVKDVEEPVQPKKPKLDAGPKKRKLGKEAEPKKKKLVQDAGLKKKRKHVQNGFVVDDIEAHSAAKKTDNGFVVDDVEAHPAATMTANGFVVEDSCAGPTTETVTTMQNGFIVEDMTNGTPKQHPQMNLLNNSAKKSKPSSPKQDEFARFSKAESPSAQFFRKAKSHSEANGTETEIVIKPRKKKWAESTPQVSKAVKSELEKKLRHSAPARMKKVNFVLHKNTSHEHRDYPSSIRNSPSIPYDASKRPPQSVLKSAPTFYATLNNRPKAADFFF